MSFRQICNVKLLRKLLHLLLWHIKFKRHHFFSGFKYRVGAIFGLKVKIVPKQYLLCSWSVVPKLVGSDSLYTFLVNVVEEISHFFVFSMALVASWKNKLFVYTFSPLLGVHLKATVSFRLDYLGLPYLTHLLVCLQVSDYHNFWKNERW